MQTSTPAKRRAPVKRAPAIPFPDLPRSSELDSKYWRTAWIRGLAMGQAMTSFIGRRSFARLPRAMRMACITSERLLQDDAKRDLRTLIETGGLLYAWIPEGPAS